MTFRNDIWQWIIAAGLFICLLLAVSGCKTPTPSLPTNSHSRDSVRIEYKHDSVTIDRWHKEYIKGDTVFIRDSVWRDRWRNKHDSIFICNSDTIYQTIEIEKQGSAFLRGSGIALWVLIAAIVLGAIIGIIIKFAK